MEARIIGLKGCGKTTLVAALAEGRGEGHVATVHVGDARVRVLSEIFQPKKTTFAEFKVREVAWPEATGRKGEMEKYLDALAGGQVYVHVLRGFDSPMLGEPAHPEADLEELDHEFLLFDLIRIERAFERAKKAPLPDAGKKALAQCQESLEAETPLREVDFDEAELTFVRGYQFLTLTPQLLVLNTESGATARHRGPRGGRARPPAARLPLPRRPRGLAALHRGAGGIRGRAGAARACRRGGGPGRLPAAGAHQLPHDGQRRGAGVAHPRRGDGHAKRPAPSTATSSAASSGRRSSPTTTS